MKVKKNPEINILPADTKFTDSPGAGDPKCLCSRCGKPIAENQIPIRSWPDGMSYEWRYHLQCILPDSFPEVDYGLEISLDPEEDL